MDHGATAVCRGVGRGLAPVLRVMPGRRAPIPSKGKQVISRKRSIETQIAVKGRAQAPLCAPLLLIMREHSLQWPVYSLSSLEPSQIAWGAVVIVLLVIFLSKVTKKSPNYPPGPPRDPIIGNARQMTEDHTELMFTEWGKRYGPFYSLLVGMRLMIAGLTFAR